MERQLLWKAKLHTYKPIKITRKFEFKMYKKLNIYLKVKRHVNTILLET